MASVSVTDTNHTRVTVKVSDLQEGRENYDKFIYRFMQNGKQIMAYVYDWGTGGYTSWEFEFSNDQYLGNNTFAPATTYSVTVDCYYGGVAYPIGPVTFTTDAISPPSGTIAPSVYPTVKDQGSAGNCVAMSLSTAMELFKAKRMGAGGSYENFSVSYIYGSDDIDGEWMNFDSGIELCEANGSPRWELVTTSFPDSKRKADAKKLFDGACPLARDNAQKQAFTGHQNIDFYDCASVASAIRSYGYFMFNFRMPNNFQNYSGVPSSGIVPQPSGGYSGANHSLALIGLTTINGKAHWIAQNGWGTSWAKSGLCYVPYDWGCGVQSPQGSGNREEACGWTCECYSVWNSSISAANPPAPSGLSASQDGKNTTATVTWGSQASGTTTLIYARKKGTKDWWPKPSYGSPFSGTRGQISFDKDTTTYELMAIAVKNNLLSQQSGIFTVSISLLELWSWTASNGSATAAQTKAMYDAIYGRRQLDGLSYLVWNDLCDKINQAAVLAGDAWLTQWGTLAETKLTTSDKHLTAKRFNALKNNVGARVSTGAADAKVDLAIRWEDFIAITTALNTWINKL